MQIKMMESMKKTEQNRESTQETTGDINMREDSDGYSTDSGRKTAGIIDDLLDLLDDM